MGYERALEMSLKKCYRRFEREMDTFLLDRTQAHLNQWVNERLEIALLSSFCLRFRATCSCQYEGPKVDGMHVLPIVHLLVCVLRTCVQSGCASNVRPRTLVCVFMLFLR